MEAEKRALQKQPLQAPNYLKTSSRNAGLPLLILCVAGIYASFLTWGVLQERIATTPYGLDNRIFRASHVINLVQSVLACFTGYIFLSWKRRTNGAKFKNPLVPDLPTFKLYLLISFCQTFASPLGYASLRYVDYLTLLLAKSCKLLPLMAVHLILFRSRFPIHKYIAVTLITLGVSMFSVFQASTKEGSKREIHGLVLLGISLLLDGLYNTTQDHMFATGRVTGPHMMCTLNFMTSISTGTALLFSRNQRMELSWFLQNHPQALRDVMLFGLCGALGQIFVFLTLENFGSVVLVTTTVTRKMMSMLLSVVMFNHQLNKAQWFGVFLVFSGIIGETIWKRYK